MKSDLQFRSSSPGGQSAPRHYTCYNQWGSLVWAFAPPEVLQIRDNLKFCQGKIAVSNLNVQKDISRGCSNLNMKSHVSVHWLAQYQGVLHPLGNCGNQTNVGSDTLCRLVLCVDVMQLKNCCMNCHNQNRFVGCWIFSFRLLKPKPEVRQDCQDRPKFLTAKHWSTHFITSYRNSEREAQNYYRKR